MKISQAALGAIAALGIASAPAVAQVTSTPVSAGEATIDGQIEFADPTQVVFELPSQLVQIPSDALVPLAIFDISAPVTNGTGADIEVTSLLNGTLPAYLTATVTAPTVISDGVTTDLPITIEVAATVPANSVGATVDVQFTGVSSGAGNAGPFSF